MKNILLISFVLLLIGCTFPETPEKEIDFIAEDTKCLTLAKDILDDDILDRYHSGVFYSSNFKACLYFSANGETLRILSFNTDIEKWKYDGSNEEANFNSLDETDRKRMEELNAGLDEAQAKELGVEINSDNPLTKNFQKWQKEMFKKYR